MAALRSDGRIKRGVLVALTCMAALHFGMSGSWAKPDDDSDKAAPAAAARFPQPVRVGALIGRTVLEPLESQPKLGRVRRIVKGRDGAVIVVVDYGGFFGFGARPIAVPIGAMALLGADMEIIGFTPDQLSAFATFESDGAAALLDDDIIRVGLAKPAH